MQAKWPSLSRRRYAETGGPVVCSSFAHKLLYNDLLSVFKKAVSAHSSSYHQRNTRSLLKDNLNGVNGMALI
jgi:hypothetical protein